MTRLVWPYQKNLWLSFGIFLIAGVLAITEQQALFMLIPFVWILFPLILDYTIVQPEKLFWVLLIVLPLSTELNITPQLGLDFPDEILLIVLTGITIVKIIHQPHWFPHSFKRHPLCMLLVIYFSWLLITCCYSVE